MSDNRSKGKGQPKQGSRYVSFGQTDSTPMETERLDATTKFINKTIEEYDRLFTTIKGNHKKFLGDVNSTDKETYIGSELQAIKSIKSAYETMWKEVSEARDKALGDVKGATSASVASTAVTTNTSNIEKILKEIATTLGKGATPNGTDPLRTGRNRLNDTEKQTETQKYFVRTSDKVIEITELFSRTLVQGRESQRIVNFGIKSLENLTSIVANFRDQEKLADSLVGIVVALLKEVLGFVSDAMMDHYNTQEEIFTNYMIYMRGSDRNIGYLKDELQFVSNLDEMNLANNIRVTDLMKKSVDLATKGLSADEARDASLSSAIYGVIAPALNTTSDIFLDLQTRGLKNITDGLAGIVESVRSTAGSSRLATTAMNTIVDKLGPIELYAQKEMLSGDAAQMLSDLEQMGYTTVDAMEIVNTVLDAYNDPYKALTSGSTMGKIIAEQYASNNIQTLTQGKDFVLDMLDTFTSGLNIDDIVSRSAVYNALGMNINPRFRQTTEGEPKDLAETPEEAYARMLSDFSGDKYQTFNELQTIAVTNTEMAMGFSTFAHEIGDKLTTITDAVCDIADTIVGSDRKLKRAEQEAEAVPVSEWGSADSQSKATELKKQTLKNFALNSLNPIFVVKSVVSGDVMDYGKEIGQNLNRADAMSHSWNPADENYSVNTNSSAMNLLKRLPYVSVFAQELAKGRAARGAYLTEATPLIAGEAGPEFVIPEQKLIDTIGTGIDQYIIANNPTPDYSVIVSAMYNVASELINAINNNKSTVTLDTSTGLMNGNLTPVMGGK